jgi:acetolactate synthase I/II/III large subunit
MTVEDRTDVLTESPDAPEPDRYVAVSNAAEALIELLIAQGVQYIFLNPGTDTAPIQEAVVGLGSRGRPVPTIVTCMYENVALAGALGYYALTKRPQVVVCHVDVGTQNLGGLVHDAMRGETAAVIIAGRAPYTLDGERHGGRSRPIQWQQDVPDQLGILRGYVKWSAELSRVEALHQWLPRAFQVAATEPAGPVYMTIARDVLAEKVDEIRIIPPARMRPAITPAADAGAIAEAAQILVDAERPIILTARTGRHPEAVAELAKLAELLGAPVLQRRDTVNIPSSHPMALNEGQGRGAGTYGLREADAVLVLDHDVPWVPVLSHPPRTAPVIQIDVDPVKATIPVWGFPVDLPIQADTSKALPQLTAALAAIATQPRRARWSQRYQDFSAAKQKQADESSRSIEQARQATPIDVNWLAAALDEALPENALVMEEAVTNAAAFQRYLSRERPASLFQSGAPGLGWALGASIGAKLAAPERTVVAITGDGTFVFGSPVAALWGAEQARAPFLTVVLNNAGYNASKQPVLELFPEGASKQQDAFPGVRHPSPPDYALLAQSCHAYGERVEDPEVVPAAIRRALEAVARGQAALLDVILAPI